MNDPSAWRVVDLSLPITEHFRWQPSLQATESLDRGDAFRTSRLAMSCHSFTHADAPAHVDPHGPAIDDIDVRQWVGEAAVIDLSECGAEQPIGADDLEVAGGHVAAGDIVLLKTCWDRRQPIGSPEYWARAPYVTRSGAEWLLDQRARCVGFDFPQDHAIRRIISGERPAPAEFITHDVLLRRGVGMLEYLCGLHQLTSARIFLVAAPIRIAGADGGPVRAVAFESPESDPPQPEVDGNSTEGGEE